MDPDKISAFLHKLASAKIITLILIVGVAAYFIHKNFDFITEITFKVDRPSGSAKQSSENDDRFQWADISVNTTLIPLQFDIPSYFLVSVTNSGPANANKLEVLVDVGRAKVTDIDIKPKDRCSISSGKTVANDPIRVLCQRVNVGESIYIYSLLSEATFRSVLVNSPNLSKPIAVEKSDSQSAHRPDVSFGDLILWLIEGVVVLAIIIFGFSILGALIKWLDKIFDAK